MSLDEHFRKAKVLTYPPSILKPSGLYRLKWRNKDVGKRLVAPKKGGTEIDGTEFCRCYLYAADVHGTMCYDSLSSELAFDFERKKRGNNVFVEYYGFFPGYGDQVVFQRKDVERPQLIKLVKDLRDLPLEAAMCLFTTKGANMGKKAKDLLASGEYKALHLEVAKREGLKNRMFGMKTITIRPEERIKAAANIHRRIEEARTREAYFSHTAKKIKIDTDEFANFIKKYQIAEFSDESPDESDEDYDGFEDEYYEDIEEELDE